MDICFKRHRFKKAIILMCIRWYLRYPLSYRQLVEIMSERGLEVTHTTIIRWVRKFTPKLDAKVRAKNYKKPVGISWKWDKMSMKIKGKLYWLYRAVDSSGDTIDFLLSRKRDLKAALRFLKKAIAENGIPTTITADKSGANAAGLNKLNEDRETNITLRQNKNLNNIVEQSHRLVRRMTRPMMGFSNFWYAASTISGIELAHMIYRGQIKIKGNNPIEQFNNLAA